jgi:hypothetical protein
LFLTMKHTHVLMLKHSANCCLTIKPVQLIEGSCN